MDNRLEEGASVYQATVGVHIHDFNCGGELRIVPGRITVKIDRVGSRVTGVAEISHDSPAITLTHTRLMVPWLCLSFVLQGEAGTATVIRPWIGRGGLVAALKGAGFDVDERSQWMRLGDWTK